VGTNGEKIIDWIDTDNRLNVKYIDKIDGLWKNKNLEPMVLFYRKNNFFFEPMINTIGQK
jgi:hypothetical protein